MRRALSVGARLAYGQVPQGQMASAWPSCDDAGGGGDSVPFVRTRGGIEREKEKNRFFSTAKLNFNLLHASV